jgi:peptide/nickel transport system permease protein
MYLVDSLLGGRPDLFADALSHIILPGIVLATVGMGFVTRITRASMLETLSQDYVRTARAKGLRRWTVLVRHALRNALIPVITVGGTLYASLMSGTVMTETIFSWPGLGRYAFSSAASLDFPAVMGVALIVGAIYVIVNVVVDLLYGLVNPRVRYQ